MRRKVVTVTVTEVSSVLDQEPQLIRKAARDQQLPHIRRPGSKKAQYHFRIPDVINYMERSGYNVEEVTKAGRELEAILEKKNSGVDPS